MVNKKVKIPVIVLASVVGALLIAVIVMCSITVRPFENMMNYDNVRVITSEKALPNGTLMQKEEYKSAIDTNLKKAGFSVMRASMEFVYSYGPEYLTEKDENDNTVNKQVTIAEARNACAATSDSYRLELEYDEMRTFTVDKSEIKFDRLVMNVKSTEGELRWVTVYLYRSDMDGVQNPEAQEYRVTPVRMRMNTTSLYNALGTIAADYK